MKTTVYLMSGGKSSTLAAYYDRHTKNKKIFYFNDTLIEHKDLYRFLVESVYFLTGNKIPKLVRQYMSEIPDLVPGITIERRTEKLNQLFKYVCKQTGLIREYSFDPWQSFLNEGFIGNSRVDVCSRKLKRDPRKMFTDKLDCDICLGFNWDELDRFEKSLKYENNLIAPLASNFVDTKKLWSEFQSKSGIQESSSYGLGFPHDNCGGMCVKAGLIQFYLLYKERRDYYLWSENRMEEIMKINPKLKPFLKKSENNVILYLTLKEYREEYLDKGFIPRGVIESSCGCALNY